MDVIDVIIVDVVITDPVTAVADVLYHLQKKATDVDVITMDGTEQQCIRHTVEALKQDSKMDFGLAAAMGQCQRVKTAVEIIRAVVVAVMLIPPLADENS